MCRRWGGLVLVLLCLVSSAEAGFGVSIGVYAPVGPRPFRGPGFHHHHHHCLPIYRPYRPYVPLVAYAPYYYDPVPVPVPLYYQPAPAAVVVGSAPTPPPPAAPALQAVPASPAVPATPSLPQPNVAPEPGLTPPPLPQPIARATHTQSLVAASADFESLVASTRHPDEKVRQDAVLRLSRVDSPRAVDALNAVLARDPMPEVRDTAARVLGGMGKAGALVALRTAAASDPDATVRQSATYSVEMIQARLRGQ